MSFLLVLKISIFDCEIKYQKGSTTIEDHVLSQSPVSENASHHTHVFDLKEIKEFQNKENVTVNGKKLIEINDVILKKKKKGLL